MSSQGPIPNIIPSDLDKEVLMAHAFGVSRLHLKLALADYEKFVKRRQRGEPVAYITGIKEFYGLEFEVNSSVLIPRPDTEKLVELALARIPEHQEVLIADICTGSGCIAITLAKLRPRAWIIATDISPEALEVARRNAKKHGVLERIEFLQGDLLAPVMARSKATRQSIDLIVSNPPYIKPDDMANLMPDVKNYEPNLALEGQGAEGIGYHLEILREAPAILKKEAFVLLEIGYDQAEFFKNKLKVYNDDAGNPRVVEYQHG